MIPGTSDSRSLSKNNGSKNECALTSYANQTMLIVIEINFKVLENNSKKSFRIYYQLNFEQDYTLQKYIFKFKRNEIEELG